VRILTSCTSSTVSQTYNLHWNGAFR